MEVFERDFEGAGVKAYGSRFAYMQAAIKAYDAHQAAKTPTPRSFFGHPHQPVLGAARKAGVSGGQTHKVEGNAHLKVTLAFVWAARLSSVERAAPAHVTNSPSRP
jgi:hypothetical protein